MVTPGKNQDDSGVGAYAKAMKSAGPLLTAGIQLAVSVVIMMFVGRWLDDRLGWTPWLMMTGIFFGLGAGMYQLIRTVLAIGRQEAEDKAKHED